jgi:hypothetical protein
MSEALAIHPAHRGWPQLGSMKSHIFHWEVTLKIPGLVNKQFANLKITIEIVDWPSYKIVIFHSFLLVYQRVMTNYEFSKIAIPAMKIMGGLSLLLAKTEREQEFLCISPCPKRGRYLDSDCGEIQLDHLRYLTLIGQRAAKHMCKKSSYIWNQWISIILWH